jgi:nucleotide-binding universal stress UspA family protein
MSVTRIVTGTDFSLPAEHAVDVAVSLARALGAELTLVHAYEPPSVGFPETTVVSADDVKRAFHAAATEGLEASFRRREGSGVPLHRVVRLGPPWVEVNAVATQENAELVVVGSRGHRAFSKFLLGSVAERVVRTATCPVLVVPETVSPALDATIRPPRHVLVALHFGDHSQRALDAGIELAARLGAKLTLVHVWSIPTSMYAAELPPPMIDFEKEARDVLDAGLTRAKARVPDAHGTLRSGIPAKEILAVAQERGADMLVLGTHGRKGLPRMFLGSVAEKVARRAEIPVLIVSAHDRTGPAKS